MSFSMTPDLLSAQAFGESGGNANIGQHYGTNDPLGRTAGGLFGFTAPTWAGMIRNHPELNLTMAGKNDPDQQKRAYPVFAAENASALQRGGVQPTPSLVSLASFLGPTAATAFAQAQPGDLASDVLMRSLGAAQAQQFMASNPNILTPTARVGDVIAHNDKTHLGSPQDPSAAPGAAPGAPPATPGMPAPMPANFGLPNGQPSPIAKVDMSGHEGDGLISTGMAMMGGSGFSGAMKAGGAAYDAASARAQALAIRNSEFQNDAIKRDTDAPTKAAEAARDRALAWNALQAPTTLTAQQQAQLEIERSRGTREDRNHAEQIAVERARIDESKRQFDTSARPTQTFIVPGDNPGQEQTVQVTTGRDGSTSIRNMTTGQDLDTMPQGAVLPGTYNARENQGARLSAKADAGVQGILTDAQVARDRVRDIDQATAAANAPGANTGPDIGARVARSIFPLLGIAAPEQDMAKMSLSQVSNAVSAAALKGQGAVSDNERVMMAKLAPQVDTNPQARNAMFGIMRDIANRSAAVGDAWMAAPPDEKRAALSSPAAMAEWKYRTTQKVQMDAQKARETAATPAVPDARPGSPGTAPRPPLSSFRAQPQQVPTASADPRAPENLVPGGGM